MIQDDTNSDICIEWHDGYIPAFAETAIDTLYGSLYSSLPQLVLGDLQGASTYVVRAGGRIRALFLFSVHRSAARVINEGMTLSACEADRFAEQLFRRFPRVARIDFHAVACHCAPAAHCALRFVLAEDIVIELPAEEADYLASLSKSMRKALRQNLARIDGLVHRLLPGPDIDAALVSDIISFNHARLAAKQRSSALDQTAASQLLTLLQARGIAGVVTVGGRLCAGTLACRIGDDLYSLVNAHHPAFDAVGMGHLARHLMIVAAIRAGVRRFHLLGGNFASKRSSGAERRPLHHLVIYRDRWRMLAGLPHLVSLAAQEQRYRLSVALDNAAANPARPLAARAVMAIARLVRTVRRARWRMSSGPRASEP